MEIEKLAKNKGYRVSEDGTLYGPKGNVVRGRIDKNGYLNTNIRPVQRSRTLKHLMIHRLQAYQKFGDLIYETGVEVRHLNGNSLDNSLNNIEIGSHRDNMLDIPKEIRLKTAAIASSKRQRKYSLERIKQIKIDRACGMSYNQLMKKYGITSKGTISYICRHNYYMI